GWWQPRRQGLAPRPPRHARSLPTTPGGSLAMHCRSDPACSDRSWTPSMVDERLAEAAAVLKRLPARRRQGYFNPWPDYFYEFGDLVGQEPEPMRLAPS